MQWRPPQSILLGDIGSIAQQHLHDLHAAILTGSMQRSFVNRAARLDVSSALEQQLGDLLVVPCASCASQANGKSVINQSTHKNLTKQHSSADPRTHAGMHSISMSKHMDPQHTFTSTVQRREPPIIPAINLSPQIEQRGGNLQHAQSCRIMKRSFSIGIGRFKILLQAPVIQHVLDISLLNQHVNVGDTRSIQLFQAGTSM